MTAHPKYYSFVGLVAPADRKAVYMGFAFLYGVIGSLLGSSLGAYLYEWLMKPVVGQPEAGQTAMMFWLMFAVLDVVAAGGLILFARSFTADTPQTNAKAAVVMRGVYILVLVIGAAFCYNAFSGEAIKYRILVQSVIFLALGIGGLVIGRRKA
jgi:hypothetical protein